MKFLFVLLAVFIGVSYSLTSESNGTPGETIDGVGLIKLGRKLRKPMLTLIGMAMKNNKVAGWTPWSSCSTLKRGYFGSQTRTRSYSQSDIPDENDMRNEMERRLCEGSCPVSYNLTNNGFCMKLNTTKVSHDEARKQCQLEGAYLMNIDSQQKLEDVRSAIQGRSLHPHIDGRRKDTTSPWKYAYGLQSAFLEWYSGYPRKELCLALDTNQFKQFDMPCSTKRPYFCEFIN